MIAGYLLSFGSFWRIRDLVRGDPLPFVVNTTVGNLIALAGSCFLSGPHAQMSRMFHETRKWATVAYLSSLALTLVVAFSGLPGPKGFILLLLMGTQYIAILWYTLSYIPFARETIMGFIYRRISTQEY